MAHTAWNRRDFLKGFGGAALAAGAVAKAASARADAPPAPTLRQLTAEMGAGLQPPPLPRAPRGSEEFWRQVRSAFVLPERYLHFNTGTTGSQPRFSLVNLGVYNVYKSLDPRNWEKNLVADFPALFPLGQGTFGPSALAARQAAVAAQYGADPDEIVLSYDTTDACNLVFAGTPWNPGDRIVTTHWEHLALAGPTAWARQYRGVRVATVGLPSNFTAHVTKADVLSLFEQELAQPLAAGAKQYLAVSEIFYKNGLRLPIPELCALARKYGAYTIVDSAHGWGQLPVDCHAYGADFIAGAGHKWLCGGPGTGIFYVRNSGDRLPPFALGNFYLFNYVDTTQRGWAPAGYVQLRGETNTPALYAMTDSAAFFGGVGVGEIFDRGLSLAAYLRGKIASRWGDRALWVQQHPDPAFGTALVSFNPFRDRDDAGQFAAMNSAMNQVLDALYAGTPRVYVRTTTWRDQPQDPADNRIGFRVSTHGVYNGYDQIDWLVERLAAAVDATGLPQLS